MKHHAKTVLNAIEVLQHLIDLEGVDLTGGLDNAMYKPAKENVKERIQLARQQRAKKDLQTFIGELGYFGIFMNFSNALPAELLDDTRLVTDPSDDLEHNASEELEHNVSDEDAPFRRNVFKKVFRQLLLLAIRLLKGEPTVNKSNQARFYTSAKMSKDNTFCKRIYTLLAREMDAFP